MRGRSSLITLGMSATLACAVTHAQETDRYLWLEDTHGARAIYDCSSANSMRTERRRYYWTDFAGHPKLPSLGSKTEFEISHS
jgi:hypothetical protein